VIVVVCKLLLVIDRYSDLSLAAQVLSDTAKKRDSERYWHLLLDLLLVIMIMMIIIVVIIIMIVMIIMMPHVLFMTSEVF